MPPLILQKRKKAEVEATKLAYIIENSKGTKVLNAPRGKWIDKKNVIKEEDYASLNQIIVPSLRECQETLAWLEHNKELADDVDSKDLVFKYVKVTFEIIGEVS